MLSLVGRSGTAIVLSALAAAAASSPLRADEAPDTQLAGVASVIDGDTIEIHGERIRLSGIDSPESGARCGEVNVYQSASIALSDFIGARTVTCVITGEDRYQRKIGTCDAGGQGLAEHMVSSGWGRDWPRYSKGLYADQEKAARAVGAGIWGLSCPADLWGGRTYD